MNVMSFAQEFSSLVIRYTKDPLPNPLSDNNQPANTPLTKQEVANAVSNVLVTLLGINDIALYASVITPTTEISTPITPIVHNINQDKNDESTCRSEDIQETPRNHGTSSTDLSIIKTEEKTTLEVFQHDKKFISQSSPAICVTNIDDSDAFAAEENQAAEVTGDLKKLNNSFAKVEVTSTILQSVNEARMSVMNFIEKLDDIKKQTFPQSFPQPFRTRRLSMGDTNSGQKSIPARVRRSVSDFPGTATSSKSFVTRLQDAMNKRKSLGHACASDTMSRKLDSVATVTPSVSNLRLSSSNKSFDSKKPAKNLKYAHVQSTIPKPISSKRKAQ